MIYRNLLAASLLFVPFIGLFAQQSANSPLRADEIVRKVSTVYQSASNYQFVAQKNVTVAAVGEERDLGGNRAYSNFHKSTETEITLVAVAPDKARVTLKDESQEIVIVKNAQTVWTYLPAKKQYSQKTAEAAEGSQAASKEKAETDYIREEEVLLVKRFQSLSAYAATAVFEKEEKLKIGGDKVDCYVLKIDTERASHELWIGEQGFIVWRSKDVSPTPQDGISMQTTVTVNVREANLSAKPDDSLFTFVAPDKAKRVDPPIRR